MINIEEKPISCNDAWVGRRGNWVISFRYSQLPGEFILYGPDRCSGSLNIRNCNY